MPKLRLLLALLLLFVVSTSIAFASTSPWISAPAGLICGLLLPGYAALLAIRRRISNDWHDVVYVVGLGVLLIMGATLVANTLLHGVGIAHPLDRINLFGSIAVLYGVLLAIGYRRWDEQAYTLPRLKLSGLEILTIVSSTLLLVGFIGGAIRLNNGTSGWMTVGCYVAVVLLVGFLFIKRRKIRVPTLIWAVWLAGLGVLLSGWLRSSYVTGIDTVTEFQVFQLVKDNGYWSIELFRNAYNACLSVSLLPLALQSVTGMPDVLIFKLLIPSLYSLILPIIFLIVHSRFSTKVALLASFFFISQPAFAMWWWVPIRQEVAFLFFALLILLLVSRTFTKRATHTMFFLLSAGLIVSHYSTAYVAVGFFALYSLGEFVASKQRLVRLSASLMNVRWTHVVILFMATFLWYSQLTYGFNNVPQFVTLSFQNIGHLFSEDVQQSGQTLADRFNIYSRPGVTTVTMEGYTEMLKNQAAKKYAQGDLYPDEPLEYAPPQIFSESNAAYQLTFYRSIAKVAGNVLIVVSVLAGVAVIWRRRRMGSYDLLILCGAIMLGVTLLLPFFSVSYGPDRLYQQLLIGICGALGYLFAVRQVPILRKALAVLLIGFIGIYFLLLNQVPYQFVHSRQRSLVFENSSSTQYYTYYMHQQDIVAANWLSGHASDDAVYSDTFSRYRVLTGMGLAKRERLVSGLVLGSINKDSYVFQSMANTTTRAAFDYADGPFVYAFPQAEFSRLKSVIYSSRDELIYK